MIRKTAAVWAGKATRTVSRATRRGGGTTLPGDIARAIDPKILTRLTNDLTHGSVVITGTNGKTTTSRLIPWLLEAVGDRGVGNRAGANLIFGVTAAALDRAGADGRLRADWGVFEIDEASLPKAVREIQPKATLVLNLFRDQLDRYGELESIARKIDDALSGMPAASKAILNADDPRVAEIGISLEKRNHNNQNKTTDPTDTNPIWFGLDETTNATIASTHLPHAADARTCPGCGASLHFTHVFVGHDGVYACPNGDFARPKPDIDARDITLDGFESLAMTIGGTRIEMPLGGLYNAYNVLAAYATARTLGPDAAHLAQRLKTFKAAFGRQEKVEFRGRHLVLVLSKNPAGFNETVKTAVEHAHAENFVIGLNDRKADGTDVSWIWDVDFEMLAGRARTVIPAGDRAHDLAVRLKYAGVKAEPPQTDPANALDLLIKTTRDGDTAHLLCTYTAMLDLRAELVRRGWAQPYWET